MRPGDHTPWGVADIVTGIAPGVWAVSTPRHGGVVVTGEAARGLPDAVRRVAEHSRYHGNPNAWNAARTALTAAWWFEEDCEVCAVILARREWFPDVDDETYTRCVAWVLRYFPTALPDDARAVLSDAMGDASRA